MFSVRRIHHVQLAIPPGGEDNCRWFWGEVLGMTELDRFYASDPFGNRLEFLEAR